MLRVLGKVPLRDKKIYAPPKKIQQAAVCYGKNEDRKENEMNGSVKNVSDGFETSEVIIR